MIFLFLLFAATALAADRIETSATQAVISYTAPSAAPCTWEISASPSLKPLINDVNPALFSGSNLDSRPTSTANGLARQFVAGARRSDFAGGALHSRALQTDSDYYYRRTCGSEVTKGQIRTKNIALGNNYPETPPFDPHGFGNYAWPSINWSDQSKEYIDPMTGALIRRVTGPGWSGVQRTNFLFGFAYDPTGTWTKMSNVLSGDPGTRATYSGTKSEPLYIAPDPEAHTIPYTSVSSNGWYPDHSYDDLRLRIFGTGSDGNPENRTMSACLSYFDSGATCDSSTLEFVLPNRGGGSGVTAPSNYPTFPHSGWGGATQRHTDFGSTIGKVNVAGTAVTLVDPGVQSASKNRFNVNWKPGAKIQILGSSCPTTLCTIASVEDSAHLTLKENAGTLSNAVYKSLASVIKVWKKTGAGSVSISVSYDFALSGMFSLPNNGAVSTCHDRPVSVEFASDGVTPITPVSGHLCINGSLLFVVMDSGETRLLANLDNVPAEGSGRDRRSGPLRVPAAAFDVSDGRAFYASATTGPNKEYLSLFRLKYEGKFAARSDPPYPAIGSGKNPSADKSRNPVEIAVTNITKPSEGKDVRAQMMRNPQWDPKIFNTECGMGGEPIQVASAASGVAVVMSGCSGETIGLVSFLDLATGQMRSHGNSWTDYPARWGAVHGAGVYGNWFNYYLNTLSFVRSYTGDPKVPAAGPWEATPTQIFKNGAWTNDTSMVAADVSACSDSLPQWVKDLGAVGKKCIKVRAPQPCSHTPHPAELAKWPCPTNAKWSQLQDTGVGDWTWSFHPDGIRGEYMMIASQTNIGGGIWEYEMVRDVTHFESPHYTTTASGWRWIMVQAQNSNVWADTASKGATRWLIDTGITVGHNDFGPGLTPGTNTVVAAGIIGVPFRVRFNDTLPRMLANQTPALQMSADAPFAGITGSVAMQSYPSMRQVSAPPAERRWFLDYHHLNGGYGAGSEVEGAVADIKTAFVPGSSKVVKITGMQGLKDDKKQPLFGWAGRYLLKEVSGPRCVINESTDWQFGYVRKPGECFAGSQAGEVYATIPHAKVGAGHCIANWYGDNYPCVMPLPASAAWMVQVGATRNDPTSSNWRRISMGFSGPGRQYQFGSFPPLPSGKWGLFLCYWCDGQRQDLMMAKLPPWPELDSHAAARGDFQQVAVTAPPNAATPEVRVLFGYAENGEPSSFFCTARQEACTTGGTPFAYVQTESVKWSSCASAADAGCKLTIPAVAGRTIYYRIDRRPAGGGAVVSGPMQATLLH